MIQANELRIGNYVSDIHASDKFFAKVNKITNDRVYYNSFHSHPNDLKPIELTEDILLNCPQVKLNPHSKIMKSYWLHLKRNLYLTFSDIETTNFIVSIICMHDNEIVDCNIIHNWDYDKEMYLHDLQNLYKDLSKTELEINL